MNLMVLHKSVDKVTQQGPGKWELNNKPWYLRRQPGGEQHRIRRKHHRKSLRQAAVQGYFLGKASFTTGIVQTKTNTVETFATAVCWLCTVGQQFNRNAQENHQRGSLCLSTVLFARYKKQGTPIKRWQHGWHGWHGFSQRCTTTMQVMQEWNLCLQQEDERREAKSRAQKAQSRWVGAGGGTMRLSKQHSSSQSAGQHAREGGGGEGGRHQFQRHCFGLFWFLPDLWPSRVSMETWRTLSSTWPGAGRNPTTQISA